MSLLSVVTSLRQIGRHFIGGYRTAKYRPNRSKYMPHQGERECARRRAQAAKLACKAHQ